MEQWGLKITLEQNVGGKCGSGLGWVTGKITSCPIVEDGDDNAHSLTMLPQPPTAWINHGSRHLDAGIHFSQQISLWSRGMEYGEDLPSASPHRRPRLFSKSFFWRVFLQLSDYRRFIFLLRLFRNDDIAGLVIKITSFIDQVLYIVQMVAFLWVSQIKHLKIPLDKYIL